MQRCGGTCLKYALGFLSFNLIHVSASAYADVLRGVSKDHTAMLWDSPSAHP